VKDYHIPDYGLHTIHNVLGWIVRRHAADDVVGIFASIFASIFYGDGVIKWTHETRTFQMITFKSYSIQ
jgi:hypothetical protein